MYKAIFTALPFVFVTILMFSFVRRSRVGTRAQAVWAMLFLACASKFVCFAAFGGDAFAPDLPEAVIWTWNWAYSGMCILLLLSVLLALVPMPKAVRLVALPLAAWGLSAWGLWNGIKVPDPCEREVWFENLPESLDGYRILHLSDLHASSAARRWRTERIVDKANAAGADLVVVTGDVADGLSAGIADAVGPLARLKAKDGVLFCPGNHEYYFDIPGWVRVYQGLGLKFLSNEWTSPRPSLVVAGVTDPAALLKTGEAPDVDAAFAGSDEKAFRVLLQHRPAIDWEDLELPAPKARYDLQLSGHTHGGVAPVLTWLVSAVNDGLLRGLYEREGGASIFVSRGIGQWAGFPMRFFDDPEMPVLKLRRKEAK